MLRETKKEVKLRIPEDLYWKLEEGRVKAHYETLEEWILKILKTHLGYEDEEIIKPIDEDKYDECIKKEFPNFTPWKQSYVDLKNVIKRMYETGENRTVAEGVVAKQRRVTWGAVHSNITRSLGINVYDLDKKIERIIDCLNSK